MGSWRIAASRTTAPVFRSTKLRGNFGLDYEAEEIAKLRTQPTADTFQSTLKRAVARGTFTPLEGTSPRYIAVSLPLLEHDLTRPAINPLTR